MWLALMIRLTRRMRLPALTACRPPTSCVPHLAALVTMFSLAYVSLAGCADSPAPAVEVAPCPVDIGARWLSLDFWRNAGFDDVRAALDCGADIETKDDDGGTPLHWAAGFGEPSVVTVLLDYGANIEAKDDSGRTPLHRAALFGEPSVVIVLLDRGANVYAQNNDGETPLDVALRNDHAAAIQALREHAAQ